MKLSPPQKVFDSGRKHFQAMQRKQVNKRKSFFLG